MANILVVEDDKDLNNAYKIILESENHAVVSAFNGKEALKALNDFEPDLILLDLWMPLLSGEQILRTIRSTDSMKDIPVIVFSASVHGDDIAFEAGADDFIAKPFDMNDLLFKINTHIGRISEDEIIKN